MTNRLALILGLILFVGMAADFALNGGDAVLYLTRKFMNLLDWVEFWR